MSKFKEVDFYYIDNLLSDEEKMVRDTTREWVEDKVLPIIDVHHRNHTFPVELIPEMGKMGFFGATINEYGCAGLNNIAYGLINQEAERGDSAIRSCISVQSGLVMYPIYEFGSKEQKEKWLPGLAKGEFIGCFGLTEPDYGSDPGSIITKAIKKDGYWVLNGVKRWITNGTIADIAIVWAKDNDGIIRGFIVEKGMKGFSAPEIKNKFSLRASVTSELILEDVEVPDENRLPEAVGLKYPLMCLNQARYGIAWGAIGSAIATYQTALDYAKTRIQFGKPVASFQITQEKLVYMITEITKMQLLAYYLGKLKDSGKVKHYHISLAKRNNVFHALEIARIARDILGASGITDEYPVMRHLMNLESVKTYEGTHDIHTLIIGAQITGIESFK